MPAKIWFPVAMLTLLVVLLVHGSLKLSTETMIFPWLLGGIGICLLAWQLVRAVVEVRREFSSEKPGANWRTHIPGLAWFLSILPMIWLLGFVVTVPLYTFLALKLRGEGWALTVILTFLVGVLLYFLAIVVRVPLYMGLLFS